MALHTTPLLSVAIALGSTLLLSGCGGGSGGGSDDGHTPTTPTTPTTPSETVTVIDGYLKEVQVCIDRNQNRICDPGEEINATTNDEGKIDIPEGDRVYPLIAQVTAGQSEDADQIGKISQSYQLYADAGSAVITPFTTLAKQLNLTFAEIAALLNVQAEVITGDYVALKDDATLGNEARQAHLFARSIISQLPTANEDFDADAFNALVTSFTTELVNQQNLGTDLDTIRLKLSANGAEVEPVDQSVEQLFARENWTIGAFNRQFYDGEFNGNITFENDKINGLRFGSFPYQFDGHRLIFGNNDEYFHEVVYQSENLILIFDDRDQPYAYTPTNTPNYLYGKPLTAEHFANQTWYHLRDIQSDINRNEPIQVFTRMDFTDNTVTLTPDGYPPIETTWEVETHDNMADTLTIHLPHREHEAFPGDEKITLLAYSDTDENVLLLDHRSTQKYVNNLLFKDQSMAETVTARWKAAPPLENQVLR